MQILECTETPSETEWWWWLPQSETKESKFIQHFCSHFFLSNHLQQTHSSHPVILHQLSQVINQSELFWIHLLTVKTTNKSYLWQLKQKCLKFKTTELWMYFLTALLSSFLMVDLPHRALTPSTATARRKSDPGCPLCSRSSFITAPTTSLLLFTRDMPCSNRKAHQQSDNWILWMEKSGSNSINQSALFLEHLSQMEIWSALQ